MWYTVSGLAILPVRIWTLHEVIPAGESRDEVLVMEVPEGYVQTIETVSLLIKANGQESVIPLLQ